MNGEPDGSDLSDMGVSRDDMWRGDPVVQEGVNQVVDCFITNILAVIGEGSQILQRSRGIENTVVLSLQLSKNSSLSPIL